MTSVSWFTELTLADRPTVGGKGASLGELSQAGIDVPPGFVVRTEGFKAFIDHLEKAGPMRARLEGADPDDLTALETICNNLMDRVRSEPVPESLQGAILSAYGQLVGEGAVAIRSSATSEDADDASFAGLQDTFLYVMNGRDALERIRDCWASLYSVNSVTYRLKRGLPEADVAMAVVVQKMVNSEVSGVMFTRSPITGDKSIMVIEAAFGLGSAVVGGEVTPDRIAVGKITGNVVERDIAEKAIEHRPKPEGGVEEVEIEPERRILPALTDERVAALRNVGKRIEKHYGKPQDIEWAIERGSGRLYILQSRGETVWSQKDAEKQAVEFAQASDPRAHVLRIFGGRT
jgi:pyruvate,water dikinase